MNRKTIYIGIFSLYLIAILTLCLIRPDSIPEIEKDFLFGIPIDKAAHFLMFLPFPILSSIPFMNDCKSMKINISLLAIFSILGAGFAFGTEVLQEFTRYRSRETADLIADIAGIATGSISATAYLIHKNRKS